MVTALFTVIIQLVAFAETIHDIISPERRRQKRREQIRRDFYDGSLLKRTRGGRGVVNRSCPNNISSSSVTKSDGSVSVSRVDLLSTVSLLMLIGFWMVGLSSADITSIMVVVVGGYLVLDNCTVVSGSSEMET